jgi:hypothetical protein
MINLSWEESFLFFSLNGFYVYSTHRFDLAMLDSKPRVSPILGKFSNTEQPCQPLLFLRKCLSMKSKLAQTHNPPASLWMLGL